jgi:hypothetical protein
VAELDLEEIERRLQAKDHRGERPYASRMMTALLLYGYAVGVFSSRKLERACLEDVAFRHLQSARGDAELVTKDETFPWPVSGEVGESHPPRIASRRFELSYLSINATM